MEQDLKKREFNVGKISIRGKSNRNDEMDSFEHIMREDIKRGGTAEIIAVIAIILSSISLVLSLSRLLIKI